jgi:hypothetical protein
MPQQTMRSIANEDVMLVVHTFKSLDIHFRARRTCARERRSIGSALRVLLPAYATALRETGATQAEAAAAIADVQMLITEVTR